ncbi:stage III sporulation protein AG [Bacillus sp. ISL-40]|uniref:stage III sporulation protein AG n=1 Tax=unclassified Bacillus (in: firmicutes) TaxID=185979 RepID=UPI001BE89F21|nr:MULTISPECIES: stage III sporulation protein AG [unclassified Bacillus (in: firmicutes)]MBT2698264.1 stage III sporulation protein AG [Bacillus sp. ISL-40]MBT2724573.1 stage III sporulation protein AG [Bacillus sp. ISL-46]MBT2740254.1 stage III sporulation protein AG [Bacillus sp. ISL-77]
MNNNQGPFSWLKKVLKIEGKSDKKPGKYQYMLVVLCIGAAFMLVGNIVFKTDSNSADTPVATSEKVDSEDVPAFGLNKGSSNKALDKYEEKYENQLKKALQEMLGVNNVTVVVNIDSTDKKVLEKNRVSKSQTTEETDREGGERKVEEASIDEQLVIIREGEKEVPIVVETKKPEIRGVLVVAKGAENIQVKKWIVEAVTRALDVPSHRVAVMPKK